MVTTAKDYNAFARIMSNAFKKISTESAHEIWLAIVEDTADYFESTNPRFRRELFINACKRV